MGTAVVGVTNVVVTEVAPLHAATPHKSNASQIDRFTLSTFRATDSNRNAAPFLKKGSSLGRGPTANGNRARRGTRRRPAHPSSFARHTRSGASIAGAGDMNRRFSIGIVALAARENQRHLVRLARWMRDGGLQQPRCGFVFPTSHCLHDRRNPALVAGFSSIP